MKLKSWLIATCMLVLLSSCDKESNDNALVSAQVKSALKEKYPAAKYIEWELKQGYCVADFRQSTTGIMVEFSAWFDNSGRWYMTETDLSKHLLPQAVQDEFAASEYANWLLEDVDVLERQGSETMYVLEVEGRVDGREIEIDLYYTFDGVLLKKVVDVDTDYIDWIPSQPSGAVEAFVKSHYPNARIVEIDKEAGVTEVDIIDGNVSRELLFDATNQWLHTKTELRRADLPNLVTKALEGSQYASYYIDDIDFMQTPSGEYYRIELDQGKKEVTLHIDAHGVIL